VRLVLTDTPGPNNSQDKGHQLTTMSFITARAKRNLKERGLSDILLKSGLPAVEAVIDEYIGKYNFPHRVKHAYDSLLKTLDTGLTVAEIDAQLDADQNRSARVAILMSQCADRLFCLTLSTDGTFRDTWQEDMDVDLHLKGTPWDDYPALHVPMLSSNLGPGFASLMVLDSMADRVLKPYVR
jgi:hypothetical protein